MAPLYSCLGAASLCNAACDVTPLVLKSASCFVQGAQVPQLSPPAGVCFDSQLRAANIFKLSQHRLAAADLGITEKCAPGLAAVLAEHGTPCGQDRSKTIDINARCCLGEEAGKSRYNSNEQLRQAWCISLACLVLA